MRRSSHLRSLSLRVGVWHPNTRIRRRLLGPCFKTGGWRPLRQHPCRCAVLGPPQGIARRAITLRRATFPPPLSPGPNRCWPVPGECPGEERRVIPRPKSGREPFPFNNFTYFLTLFSKCFSSFDHSTCALSVSGQYLALEDIYLPFRAAFPNYSTRRGSFTQARRPTRRGSHPLWRPVPGNSEGAAPKASSANYNSGPGGQISNLSCCRFTRRY